MQFTLRNTAKLAAAIALASQVSTVMAAGFQLNSQSGTGMGRAFAGDAIIADNASVLSRNPAAMSMFDSAAISGGLSVADVTVEATEISKKTVLGATTNLPNVDNAAEVKLIPNFYYVQPINDRFAIGFAGFSNYGTGTDFSELAGKAPADLVGETAVTTMNFNTSMSFRVNDYISLGAGLDVIYGSGKLTRQKIGSKATVDVDASGVGVGGIFGISYEINENHRLGFSYRISPDMEVEGDIIYTGIAQDKMIVPLADIAQFAGYHKFMDQFALSYTVQWTEWSNMKSIDKIKNGQTSILKEYNWKNSLFLSVGAEYYINDNWTVRAGYAFDQGVVGDKSIPSTSMPDSHRNWLSTGVSYHISKNHSIDFGYSLVLGKATVISEKSSPILGGTVLQATAESGANYFSAQYSYQF